MHEQNDNLTGEKENGKMRETEMTELKNVTKLEEDQQQAQSDRKKKQQIQKRPSEITKSRTKEE